MDGRTIEAANPTTDLRVNSSHATLLVAASGALTGLLLLPAPVNMPRFLSTSRRKAPFITDLRMASSLIGALIGAVASLLLGTAATLLLLAVLGGLVGYFFAHHRERSRARARLAHVRDELPVLIEMLALAISAGDAPASALQRICAEGNGPLMSAMRGVVSDLSLGSTFTSALAGLRRELPCPEIDRFVDGVCVGHERGTPLTQILHAQAVDARERQRRQMIERAGSTEVAMMIPVVFLIMPVTIIFALFPSLYGMTWIK